MFCVSSDLDSGKLEFFILGGGGVLCKLRSELRKESYSFSFGGVFCVSSDLNSGKKVRVFHFGKGVFCAKSHNRGVLGKFGQNFLEA